MKTLLLIRHAKSSWDDPSMDDFDRPLNDRGKEDAPEMASRIREKIKIRQFITSPAKRAKRTARYFAEEWGLKKDDILEVDELYGAGPDAFRKVIDTLMDEYDTVALFSHNPGITEFANSLTNVRIDDMPTCSVFAVSAETEKWSFFNGSEKKFLFFDYPKNPLG
jgi:phosphohistidine phosphatase